MRSVIVVALVLAAAPANAGMICATDDHGDANPAVELKALETFAKTRKPSDELGYISYCLSGDTKHKARILAACETILARDPSFDSCKIVAASLATPVIGKVDVFAWVAKMPLEPWNVNSSVPDYPLSLFRGLADPRAAAIIMAMWQRLIPIEAKHEHSSNWMNEWSGWRQHAAAALATTGGADDAAFLTAQAAATRDTHVKQACLDAAAEITKRIPK